MHDFINEVGLSTFKCPKLKGHVKIELKNVETGKKEVAFEGDNMITNALADIFASNYCGALDYRKLLPLYSKMLGGVLCFQNSLDVTSEGAVDDYFIPDNSVNTVTAHAGQTTFSDQADDITRGNPLNTSMVVTDGAVTLAYEWGSSAGNGTIASVALTHSDVGDAGTGSDSQAFANLKPAINAGFGLAMENVIFFVGKDGYGYNFSTSGTTVTINKIPMAYEKVGLVALAPFSNSSLIETHNVTVTTNFGSAKCFYCFDYENNNLWLFYNTSTSRNVSCEQISLTNYTATNRNFQTDSVAVGRLDNGNTYHYVQVPFDGEYVYLKIAISNSIWSNNLLKVKLPPNHADQRLLEAQNRPYGSLFIPNASHRVLAGKAMVINNNVLYPTATDDSMTNYGIQITGTPFMNTNQSLAVLGGQISNSNAGYYVTISKFYLGTKFNLPTPIQKSNSQSMVVTYTLTEV